MPDADDLSTAPAPGPSRRGAAGRVRGPLRRRPGHLRHRIAIVAVTLLTVLAVAAGWLWVDATRARSELQAAAGLVVALEEQVVAGDRETAAATLADLQSHASAARSSTRGPHWWLARLVPGAGDDVAAVQVVADVVHRLASEALPGLMEATELVDPKSLAPVDGRIDLEPLQAAAPTVVAADAAVQDAAARIGAIDTGGLWAPLSAPLEALDEQIRSVAMTTATAARAVQLLPAMLGADEPRDYLLLVQNNAEQRATGGMPGAVVHLRADDGAVRVVEQRTAGGPLSGLPEPVLPLTPAEVALFGEGLGVYMADVTFTPDFPRTGELARAIWQRSFGGDIDGVMSIDPGAMALLLGATGPVDLPPGPVADAAGGALTAENAVEVLLNTVYLEVEDVTQQDTFFAATGAAVFGAVLSGAGDPVPVVEALAESARQGRLMVWSAHEEEQRLLTGTVLSGELVGARGDSPVVGVYLNEGSGSKIGYYLHSEVTARTASCGPDGTQTIVVSVGLTSNAPADAATLPFYVSGGRVVDPGVVRMNVLVYAPEGGVIEEVDLPDGVPGVFSDVHEGLAVAGATVELAPAERAVLEYTVRSGPGLAAAPELRVTPTASGNSHVEPGAGCL